MSQNLKKTTGTTIQQNLCNGAKVRKKIYGLKCICQKARETESKLVFISRIQNKDNNKKNNAAIIKHTENTMKKLIKGKADYF